MRIFYYCPDTDEPIGGTKQLYRHVDILNAAGYDAYAMHESRAFRYTWFVNETRCVWDAEVQWRESDWLVVPEVVSNLLIARYPTRRRVVFNQNAYYTFRTQTAVEPGDNHTPYLDPGSVVASMVVSEDNERLLRHILPEHPIFRVYYALDDEIFYPQWEKKKQIAFMPRKHLDDAVLVLNSLRVRGKLDGYTIKAVDGVSERRVAEALRESMFFFSFGYPEGCPRPPHEAMACGAIVVGYHGMGGRELLRPELSYPVEVGDILGYLQQAESALALAAHSPELLRLKAQHAYEFARDTYSLQRERDGVITAWEKIRRLSA